MIGKRLHGTLLGLAVLALLAYSINAAAYMSRIGSGLAGTLLVGAVLVITGYVMVAVAKVREAVDEVNDTCINEINDTDKIDVVHHQEEGPSPPSTTFETIETIGYGLLAVFFTTSLFLGTNVTVRFYDPLAALGYTAMVVSKWLPILRTIGALLLVLYYIFGAMIKVGKTDWPNRAQLVGRIGLAIFYAGTVVLPVV